MAKRTISLCLLFISLQVSAQKNISIDFSNVKNTKLPLSGINASIFYHFNEHLSGGIELNRFFEKKIIEKDIEIENSAQEVDISAWDFDCNFHYNFSISKKWKPYTILGFSHASDKEKLITLGKEHTDHFWSVNTGLGFMYSIGKISPHIEYLFTWGRINQEFLLVGFSYELGHKKKRRND
jgi:hypothetical protein